MPNPKIFLHSPHVELVGSVWEHCVNYRLSEAVEGITDGDVGYEPDAYLTDADVLEALKGISVDDINARQSTYVFDRGDVDTWEVV